MKQTNNIQQDKLSQMARRALDYSAGMTISASIYLGNKLGLYKAMQNKAPMTSIEFAKQMNLHERWIREWLRGQVAAGFIEYDENADSFLLSSEAAMVLADESNPYFQADSFIKLLSLPTIVNALETSFQTGAGFTFDLSGMEGACDIEKTFAAWYRTVFLEEVLPSLDQVEAKLSRGAKVADIGCGAGVALIEMAKKFPQSQFYGYEISTHALDRAYINKQQANVDNVRFMQANDLSFPKDSSFDFVTLFDSLHDMSYPQEMLADIQQALKIDGSLFIADLNTKHTFVENLQDNPFVRHMYSWSLLYCLPCSLAHKDGAGLGTLGLSKQTLENMLVNAGLKIYKTHDFGNPLQAYYEIIHNG